MIFLLALAFAAVAAAVPTDLDSYESTSTVRYTTKGMTFDFTKLPTTTTGKGFCGTCTSLTGSAIQTLMNYILQAGIVGGCAKVCSAVKNKALSTVCSLGCDIVGVKAFAAAIEKADLDPIYLCDLLKACPIDDNGAGKIDTVTVTPASGAQGTPFAGAMQVTVTNHTGAGEFVFQISGGVDQPSGASSIYPELAPGSYGIKITVPTKPSEDPTQGPQWVPGSYTLTGAFCMGECGSDHPHSKVFGQTSTNFTVTA